MTINISELKTLVTTLLHPITIFLYFGINRAEFFCFLFCHPIQSYPIHISRLISSNFSF